MSQHRRIPSPRIVEPHGLGPWVLLSVLVLAAVVASFLVGVYLAQEQGERLEQRAQALAEERDRLGEQLSTLQQEKIVLERTLKIDREANHTAQESLKQAQDERLGLEKEVSFLKRLIREGGGGILRVQDFKLTRADTSEEFGYSFTVTQLIQDFGESSGRVEITVAGKRDGKEAAIPLVKLAGSKPTAHKMQFQHFQNFEGRIKLPDDLDAENLIVKVKPSSKKLIPVTETFAWSVAD